MKPGLTAHRGQIKMKHAGDNSTRKKGEGTAHNQNVNRLADVNNLSNQLEAIGPESLGMNRAEKDFLATSKNPNAMDTVRKVRDMQSKQTPKISAAERKSWR